MTRESRIRFQRRKTIFSFFKKHPNVYNHLLKHVGSGHALNKQEFEKYEEETKTSADYLRSVSYMIRALKNRALPIDPPEDPVEAKEQVIEHYRKRLESFQRLHPKAHEMLEQCVRKRPRPLKEDLLRIEQKTGIPEGTLRSVFSAIRKFHGFDAEQHAGDQEEGDVDDSWNHSFLDEGEADGDEIADSSHRGRFEGSESDRSLDPSEQRSRSGIRRKYSQKCQLKADRSLERSDGSCGQLNGPPPKRAKESSPNFISVFVEIRNSLTTLHESLIQLSPKQLGDINPQFDTDLSAIKTKLSGRARATRTEPLNVFEAFVRIEASFETIRSALSQLQEATVGEMSKALKFDLEMLREHQTVNPVKPEPMMMERVESEPLEPRPATAVKQELAEPAIEEGAGSQRTL